MKIVLIGFMGSGKSTVAKQLSYLMGFPYIETDDLACQRTNRENMQALFALGGELLLRETEIAIAKEYAEHKNIIISTGGGVVLNKINLDYLKQGQGSVIFLRAQFDTIVERLSKDSSRPLFKNISTAKQLYGFRQPLYSHYADTVVDVDSLSVEEIAMQIKEKVVYGL